MKKMKFIVVVHAWHVTSKAWLVREVEAGSENEAYGVAAKLASELVDPFYNRIFKLIPLQDHQTIKRRRLTWVERILGYADL